MNRSTSSASAVASRSGVPPGIVPYRTVRSPSPFLSWNVTVPTYAMRKTRFTGRFASPFRGRPGPRSRGSSIGTATRSIETGKEKFRFGKSDKSGSSDDRFGWTHEINGCKAGVCVLDSNYGRITMWQAAKGEFVASVSLKTLCGLDYGWFNSFDVERGTTWLAASQSRTGTKNVSEGSIYRIKGL